MSTALTAPLAAEIERVLIGGDLARLTPDQRIQYYNQVCNSVGLNPMTKPFDYLSLNGKTVLYANRNCSDQLRSIKGVSIFKVDEQEIDGLYIVTVYASTKDGRQDADKGAVNIANLKGEARANAILKAVTKAKRRVTLSICGLGWLDETEVEAIPGAYKVVEDPDSGQLKAPDNTKEAQQEYLVSRGIPTPPPTSPEVIRELSATLDQPPKNIVEMRHASKVAEADAALKETKKDKGRSGAHGVVPLDKLANWTKVKDAIRVYTGNNDLYKATLMSKAGCEHSNEIQTKEQASAAWDALQAELKRLGLEANRKKQDDLLRTEMEMAHMMYGPDFIDLIGLYGCETIEHTLELSSEPLEELRKAVKNLGKQDQS